MGQFFPTPGPGFAGRAPAVLQRPRHGHGHLLLLRAILEVRRFGKNSSGREDFLDLGDEVRTGGGGFVEGDHAEARGKAREWESWKVRKRGHIRSFSHFPACPLFHFPDLSAAFISRITILSASASRPPARLGSSQSGSTR